MKKVYVLMNSWHTDSNGSDFGIVGIFLSKENAIAKMKECVADEIANDFDLYDENGKPLESTVVEEDELSWCAYTDDEYLMNSCEYKITEEYIYE